MALSYVAAGSSAGGTTSINVPHPAGLQAGDMLLLWVTNKYPASGPSTPSGWTRIHQRSGGSGLSGVDSGTVYLTVYSKIANGSESGNQNVIIISGNSSVGKMICIRKPNDASWLVVGAAEGTIITPATNESALLALAGGSTTTPLKLLEGDFIAIGYGINSDGQTFSSYTLTTIGTLRASSLTEFADDPTTSGDDTKIAGAYCTVTSGALMGQPTFNLTASATLTNAPCGAVIAVILRVDAPENRVPIARKRTNIIYTRKMPRGVPRVTRPRNTSAPDMDELLGR